MQTVQRFQRPSTFETSQKHYGVLSTVSAPTYPGQFKSFDHSAFLFKDTLQIVACTKFLLHYAACQGAQADVINLLITPIMGCC